MLLLLVHRRQPMISIVQLLLLLHTCRSQSSSVYHNIAQMLSDFKLIDQQRTNSARSNNDGATSTNQVAKAPAVTASNNHHQAWISSGKFQGDIDGIDPQIFQSTNGADLLQYNALRNKQLMWPGGIIPYELDVAFAKSEREQLEKAFDTYRQKTCIRFEPHFASNAKQQPDYLYITKGYGCYSQVGRIGGRQEVSLGRGCLFHEIIVHELMHTVGFWHEHSRADRDGFIRIRWDNILPGMHTQFDKISAALQDLMQETYDYRSIMHYDSTAFSKNGQNTIETVQHGFTAVIGAAMDLSEIDIRKINKLYKCFPTKRKEMIPNEPTPHDRPKQLPPTITESPTPPLSCQDHFLDCPYFHQYCERASFYFVMKSYCPHTCRHC